MRKCHVGRMLAGLCLLAACSSTPTTDAAFAPDWLKTDAGQSRVWLSCSGDDGATWHRVASVWGPGQGMYRAAYESACSNAPHIILRWEIDP